MTSEFPAQRASNAKNVLMMSSCTVGQTVVTALLYLRIKVNTVVYGSGSVKHPAAI